MLFSFFLHTGSELTLASRQLIGILNPLGLTDTDRKSNFLSVAIIIDYVKRDGR